MLVRFLPLLRSTRDEQFMGGEVYFGSRVYRFQFDPVEFVCVTKQFIIARSMWQRPLFTFR